MRILLTLLALLALPSAALAQMASGPMVPNRGPLYQGNNPQGITVTGQATKRVPATSARLVLQFYAPNPPNSKDPAPSIDENSLQPVIDALVKVGVPRENITFPNAFRGAANNATIEATVANPTAMQIQNGIATLTTTMLGLHTIFLNNAQVTLEANCGLAADALRVSAITNARAKANAIAKELGVHVGPVLNVTANDAQTQNGTCNWPYYLGQGQNPQMASPDDYVSVPVNSFISITYAIKN